MGRNLVSVFILFIFFLVFLQFTVSTASHFVLVHGACHGSWCWYKVATLLKSAGHRVTTVDLGGAGINPKQPNQMTTLSVYLEPLMGLMAALQPEEKVILVGHSAGGVAISVAAEKFTKNVDAAVYVTASMPKPGFNILQFYQQLHPSQFGDSNFTLETGAGSSSLLFGPKFLESNLYQLSPPEDLTLALSLIRPVPIFRDDTSLKAAKLTDKRYGSIRRVYIMSERDLIVTEKMQKEIISSYPPQDVKKISGSDHMVMFSKPGQLASLLQTAVVSTASHFVLVHGACHGSWCWYKVATLLKSAGHTVTTVDLGGSGINPKQPNQMTTLSVYLEPLMGIMAALQPDDKVILVGHSAGGVAISVAAEKFTKNVAAAVYVAAVMPKPDFDIIQYYQKLHPPSQFKFGDSNFSFETGAGSSSLLFGPKHLESNVYPLSPPEDLTLALSLIRPFPVFRDDASLKAAKLTDEKYGSIRRVYIMNGSDLVLTEKMQKEIIGRYPPQDVKEISGADHMVMCSKPQELASLLQTVAEEM